MSEWKHAEDWENTAPLPADRPTLARVPRYRLKQLYNDTALSMVLVGDVKGTTTVDVSRCDWIREQDHEAAYDALAAQLAQQQKLTAAESERDAAELDRMVAERDALAMDRDALVCEVASLKAQLQMAAAGVAALKKDAGDAGASEAP